MVEQENELKNYLREQNIPFKHQTRWIGYGEKEWITDFYLPAYQTIIECKDYSKTDLTNPKYIQPRIERAYKDIYKLDELGELFELQKVFYMKIERAILPPSFIANITAHKIFFMTEQNHLLPILQGIEILTNNKERYVEEKLKIRQTDFDTEKQKLQKTLEKYQTTTNEKKSVLQQYAEGLSYKDLGLHPQELSRILRKYVKITLTEGI